jgi:hypothetical protein
MLDISSAETEPSSVGAASGAAASALQKARL